MLPCALASKLKNWDRHCRSHFRHLGRPLSSFDGREHFRENSAAVTIALISRIVGFAPRSRHQFSLEAIVEDGRE
jgi:hypothetical protein